MNTLSTIPAQDGFRMPGEFEPHVGSWMLWPERPDNWRLLAAPAQATFTNIALAISRFEQVTVGVSDAHYRHVRRVLPHNIRVVSVEYDDAWARDTGPTCVVNMNNCVRGVDWEFNSWGGATEGLFASWDKDNAIASQILEIENIDRYKSNIVLEGGAIHVDGDGTLITTEDCLLNHNRNPYSSKEDIELHLKQYLGVSKIVWLKRGVHLDETGGHIDNLCCFIRPGVVALTWTDDKSDPQHEISSEAYEILSNTKDAKGRRLEIHKIHQPTIQTITLEESQGIETIAGTIPRNAGDRLPASYVNFYIANNGVIMPIFNDPFDLPAYRSLKELLPDKEIVQIYSREILLGGGNIHCIVQQIPQSTALTGLR